MKTLEDLGYTRSNATESTAWMSWMYGAEVYFIDGDSGMGSSVYILVDCKNNCAGKVNGHNESQYFTLDELKAVTALLEENKHD